MDTEESERIAIAERNQKQSPFLRLPRELRDMIYGFALDTAIICVDYDDAVRLPPSLILVCRQIYQEAQPYFHDYTTVLITRPIGFGILCALESIHAIADSLRQVRVFELSKPVAKELIWAEERKMLSFWRTLGMTIGSFPTLESIVWPHEVIGGKVSAGKREAVVRYCFDKPYLRVIVRVPRKAAPPETHYGPKEPAIFYTPRWIKRQVSS
ncbi:hypothetical protein E8E13_009195 [Curvularia kusanoi]|uniref:Uncharacterized protein n=1 Tax=Curvularia kusanoi TaxID=90978 RepID=A0A9P4TL76_CURKU|nr:hypothetical protein E8E13_009195 [Curvularia kusanoi]